MKKKSIIILAVTLAILLILAIILPLVLLLPKKKSPSSEMISMAKAKEYMVNGLKTTDDPENRNIFKIFGDNIRTTAELSAKIDDVSSDNPETENIFLELNITQQYFTECQFESSNGHDMQNGYEIAKYTPESDGLTDVYGTDDYIYIIYEDNSKHKSTTVDYNCACATFEDACPVNMYYDVYSQCFTDEKFDNLSQNEVLKENFKNGFSLQFDLTFDDLSLMMNMNDAPEEMIEQLGDSIIINLKVYFNKNNQITKFDVNISETYTAIVQPTTTKLFASFTSFDESVDPSSSDWYQAPDWFIPEEWEDIAVE